MNYSESEALEQFDEVSSFVAKMGDLGQPTDEEILSFIKKLEAVEDTVVKQAMFSENEELDEINEENLK
jgi:hypothetical protein